MEINRFRPWWDESLLGFDTEIDDIGGYEDGTIIWLLDDLYEQFKSNAYQSFIVPLIAIIATVGGIFFDTFDDAEVIWVIVLAPLCIVIGLTVFVHSLIWSSRFKWRLREAEWKSKQAKQLANMNSQPET